MATVHGVGNQEAGDQSLKRATPWDRAVGQELRRCREAKGVSQEWVRNQLPGIETSMLRSIELGRQRITLGVLKTICRVLEVSTDHVLAAAGYSEGTSVKRVELEDFLLGLDAERYGAGTGDIIRTIMGAMADRVELRRRDGARPR